MAQDKKPKRRRKVQAKDVEGLKYFKLMDGLLDSLHDNATGRGIESCSTISTVRFCCFTSLALHSRAFELFNKQLNWPKFKRSPALRELLWVL